MTGQPLWPPSPVGTTLVMPLLGHWPGWPAAGRPPRWPRWIPNPFYDFADTRPRLHLEDDGSRSLIWPSNDLMAATVHRCRDTRRRRYRVGPAGGHRASAQMANLRPADRGHGPAARQPAGGHPGGAVGRCPPHPAHPIYGSSDDPEMAAQLGLTPSSYEGPTGIVGVLHNACATAGLQTASLWAAGAGLCLRDSLPQGLPRPGAEAGNPVGPLPRHLGARGDGRKLRTPCVRAGRPSRRDLRLHRRTGRAPTTGKPKRTAR